MYYCHYGGFVSGQVFSEAFAYGLGYNSSFIFSLCFEMGYEYVSKLLESLSCRNMYCFH